MSDGIESGKIILKVLSSNEISLTILSEDKFKGKVVQPGKSVNRAIGEHGFALSIKVKDNNEEHLFLLDTGGLTQAIIENTKQFNINLNEIEKIVISHGHFDHWGGLTKVIPSLKEGCEIYLHPECYLQFYALATKSGLEPSPEELLDIKNLEREGKIRMSAKLPIFPKNVIENLAEQYKVKIIETKNPIKLYNGISTSGEIELFDSNEITRGIYIMKSRKELQKNSFRDETSIYINIKDKGLIVLTGCGHCGIINTIMHGQKMTGIEKIYGVIGGFHEEWNPIEKLEKKVKYFEELNPEIICGMHCTGFNFNKLMSRHPSHTLGIVGTEFHL